MAEISIKTGITSGDVLEAIKEGVSDAISVDGSMILNAIAVGVKEAVAEYLEKNGLD
jgi:hypothetical protein